MLNVKKIEAAMSDNKITKTKLCASTGIARTTLDAILNGSDAKMSTIEAISKMLNVRIGFLFDEEVDVNIRASGRDFVEKGKIEHKGPEYIGNPNSTTESDLREQIAQLKSQLADKDKIIALYERDSK